MMSRDSDCSGENFDEGQIEENKQEIDVRDWEISDFAEEFESDERVQPPVVNGEKSNFLKMRNE